MAPMNTIALALLLCVCQESRSQPQFSQNFNAYGPTLPENLPDLNEHHNYPTIQQNGGAEEAMATNKDADKGSDDQPSSAASPDPEVTSSSEIQDGGNTDEQGNPRSKKATNPYTIPEEVSADETSYISRSYSDARLFPLPPPSHAYCVQEEGVSRVCRQRANCFYRYSLGVFVHPSDTCTLDGGVIGVCCPTYDFGSEGIVPYDNDDYYEEALTKPLKTQDFQQLYERGLEQYQNLQEAGKKLVKRGHLIPEESPDYRHVLLQKGSADTMECYRNAVIRKDASKYITQELSLQPPVQYHLWNTSLNVTCRPPPSCYPSSYRQYDGTCNNLKNPLWGSNDAVLHRLLAPNYADGVDAPRKARDGSLLPSARLVSLIVISTAKNPLLSVSHLIMSFGQFVSHDIARVPIVTDEDGKSLNCCSPDVLRFPACMPILPPPFDSVFARRGVSCLQFTRSMPAAPENCKISYYREQMSSVSAFLDVSNVYGTSKKDSSELREYENGLLKVAVINGEAHLPTSINSTSCGSAEYPCFKTGDVRSDQHPGATLMQLIFMREHNRIAVSIKHMNPSWSDETIYQEARKVVIAEHQHIVFNEYLPIVLDYTTRQRYQLLPQAGGYNYRYNPTIKPNIVNAFAVAAYRFGHSLVKEGIHLVQNDNHHTAMKLEDYFLRTELFYTKYNTERLTEGYITNGAEAVDKYYAEAIVHKLFKSKKGFGVDLFSINVQRSRDHGVPPYNEYRRLCGLPYAKSFDDLIDVMPYDSIEQLRRVYTSVHDMDLYVGGILEYPRPGGLVGPTFSCIIADQFRRIRLGDRYWYERYNEHEKIGFTPEQLQEIRKVTLARLLCDNTHIGLAQPLVLLKPGPYNQKVLCSDPSIAAINFRHWRQRR